MKQNFGGFVSAAIIIIIIIIIIMLYKRHNIISDNIVKSALT